MAKGIKIYKFDELSPEAQEVAIEQVREDYYRTGIGQDFAQWATDDDYLFEPKHDEMVALFGEGFKVIPSSKYGDEPMIGNTRKKLYWSLDRNRHIDADDAIVINNEEMFLTWLGIPKEMHDKVYFRITDNGHRDADTVIEFEPNDSDYEFTDSENDILTAAEEKFINHMDSVLDRIETDIEYRYSDEAIREDIESNDIYEFFKNGKIAKGFDSDDLEEMRKGGNFKQIKPQYGHENYGGGDKQKKAKPVGYRYIRIEDKKTGRLRMVTKDDREYYIRPSAKLIKAYEDKDNPMHKKARKMLYFERRKDHSDAEGRKMSTGGSLQSLTTKELAEKAGMTMSEVNRFGYDRDDLIAMITEGNYANGGGVGKYVQGMEFYDTRFDLPCKIFNVNDNVVEWEMYRKNGTVGTQRLDRNQFHYLVEKGAYQIKKYSKGGGVGLKERSERDSIKLAQAYQKVLDSNFADKEYDNYQKMVKETQIPKDELEKIEQYIATTPKGQQRMIDIYRYWGTQYANGGGVGEKTIYYKGMIINRLFPSGYYQFFSETKGNMRFDDLKEAKKFIDDELKSLGKKEYSKGGGVNEYDKGVVLVKTKQATNHNEVWDILNEKWSKYDIVNSRTVDLETPYSRGFIADGTLIDVKLLKKEGKYYWDWKAKFSNGGGVDMPEGVEERLEYLRGELRAERISYDELLELQSLAKYIDHSDVELLEAAGVPEHGEDDEDEMRSGGGIKQIAPQYGHKKYGSGDVQKRAKPVGYRYRKIRDSKTGRIRPVTKEDKQYYQTPSQRLIRDYEKGDKTARKMLYFERRTDHSDREPLKSLKKFSAGGSVTIENRKAKYQVKYKLNDDDKQVIGYIVEVRTPDGNAVDHYLLYNKNKELVKQMSLQEAQQMVNDKKIVRVKTYDIVEERLETDAEKSVKDMDYSERRNWIQDHIIPHLKSASLVWNSYEGGSYDYNDEKESERFLKEVRQEADYKNEAEFNKTSGFKIDESGWGIVTKDGEDLEEVASDNTYNWSYLGLITWNFRVYKADDERYFLIAHPHRGGDVRGNYGDPIIFEGDSEEGVLYDFREKVIDGRRTVYLEFKDKSELTFDAQQDSDVDYFELVDRGQKLKLNSPAELVVSTHETFGSWNGDDFLVTIVDEFEREYPKKKKKKNDGGEYSNGGGVGTFKEHKQKKAKELREKISEINTYLKKLENINTEKAYEESKNLREVKSVYEAQLLHLEDKYSNGGGVEVSEPELLLDSHHGIYIPKMFYDEFDFSKFGLDKSNFPELSDPENEGYWDAWDDILRDAETADGKILYQHEGDLFLVDKDYNFDDMFSKGGRMKSLRQKREQYHDRDVEKYGSRDGAVKARPVGYRYRKVRKNGRLRAVTKDDKEYYGSVTKKDIKLYEEGNKDARRRIYFENRKDHSDKNPSANRGYRKGGEVSPEKMNVIINIQMMRERIFGSSYDKNEDFENMKHMSLDELRDVQDTLITEYNKSLGK